MPQKNTAFLTILLTITLITLSACGRGGGYTYQPWEFNRDGEPKAQQQPNQISTPSEYGIEQPQVQTAQSPHNSGPQIQNAPYNTNNTRSKLPPVKVGLLLPLTGKHQNLGQSMLKAAQMALFDIGYDSFELVPRDTKGTRAGAKEAARTALAEGSQLILGPLFADSVRAVKESTKFSNVNVIGFSTNWSLAGDNTYIMGFLPFDQIERILGYAARNNLQRMAVIAPSSEYGRVVVSATESIAPQIGLKLSKVKTYPPGTNNLSLTVREFTGYDNPNQTDVPFDAVFMPVGGNEAIAMAGLLSEYGLQPNQVKRLGTGLFDDTNLARENSLSGSVFAAPSPKLRTDFESRFLLTYGYPAPRISSLAYDATALATVLAERGLRSTGRPAFNREAITNPNGFSGIDGIFRFRPNGTAERGLAILEFRNGQIRIVEDPPKTFQAYRPF